MSTDRTLSEKQIDEIVEAQADDDSAWGKPTRVRRREDFTSIALTSELAARAALIAHLHGETKVENWIAHVVLERVALEESIFAELKRDLAEKNNG